MLGERNWRRLEVPGFCERLIGFSVPKTGRILIVSYDGVHLLHLDQPVRVTHSPEHAEYDIYDPDTGKATYRGSEYSILGLHGGSPVLASPSGERLELDTAREQLRVTAGDRVVFETRYDNFSGDWAAATFSPDGRWIVLACPYDFDFRVWQRVVPGTKAHSRGRSDVPDPAS